MKNFTLLFAALILSLATLPSCNKCLQGNKDITTRNISPDVIPSYTDVVNPMNMDVKLAQGPKEIIFQGEVNILPTLIIEHKDNEITLGSTEKCLEPRKELIAGITNPSFQKLVNSGTGNWTGDELNFNPDITLSGTGNFTLKGASSVQTILLSGTGNIDLLEMPTTDARITLSGTGDVKVKASGLLKVTISGTGNVYYSGTPASIEQVITGTGNLIQL